MKIGITCYPTYGGSGVVATELGLELAQRGHDVHFISYAQPIRLTEPQPHIHFHEVEVSRYPLFDYPPYDLNKIASVKFADSGSPAAALAKAFQWTNDDQNTVSKYIAVDKMSDEDAAKKWVDANPDKVNAWLAAH